MRISRTWGVVVALAAGVARAEGPADFEAAFAAQARGADPSFAGPSAARGGAFFREPHGGEWSCASCHGATPTVGGRHAVTGKPIAPLAPSANPERFTRPAEVEKWFRRNCKDVLGRPCTPAEKSDVLAFLRSLGPEAARR